MVNFPRDPRRGLFEVDAYSWLCLDSRGVELPGCSREHNPPQSSTQESFCSPAGRKLSTERMTEATAVGFIPSQANSRSTFKMFATASKISL